MAGRGVAGCTEMIMGGAGGAESPRRLADSIAGAMTSATADPARGRRDVLSDGVKLRAGMGVERRVDDDEVEQAAG